MANNISILIKAEDQASNVIKGVSRQLEGTSSATTQQSTLVSRLSENWQTFAGISVASGVALGGLFGQLQQANDSANKLQGSLIGLNSVARAFNQDAGAAKTAAQNLATDGLMTVADAATGLKNLLAAGFNLDQAVTLMKRFKDSAAFGRQSALTFGQAVSSATEGIKNGNSILVDNAGVTKNLSVMLEEAGYSAQDLMKASSDGGIRQAIYNGILRETNAQLGDAQRLTDSAAGKQAQLSAQTEKLYQQIGIALQPALLALLKTVTPIIVAVADWVSKNPELTTTLIVVTASVLALSTAVGGVATAITAAKVILATFAPAVAASMTAAKGSVSAFRTLVSSPIGMGAIAVAGALADIALVMKAVEAVRGAIDAMNNARSAADAASKSDAAARSQMKQLEKSGTPEQKARATAWLNRFGRAAGGPVMGGQSYLVGENGPELFTPAMSGSVTRTENINRGVTVQVMGNVSVRDDTDLEQLARRVASLIDQRGQRVARGLAA